MHVYALSLIIWCTDLTILLTLILLFVLFSIPVCVIYSLLSENSLEAQNTYVDLFVFIIH